MRYQEERTIYMIKPEYLLEDMVRALRKLGFSPALEERGEGWLIEASKSGRYVKASLRSEKRVLPGLEVFGLVPISHLRVEAEGPEGFVQELRRRLEIELLRCLG
ncbi:hypothetical protein DRO60_05280 [Candidatus Bathyarchaeota archaeon]|nr:MAG: hypothetical protein DRO60_05280 [Candidatus Bathyarchaeota archaeon]